jgi:hypothetical protein
MEFMHACTHCIAQHMHAEVGINNKGENKIDVINKSKKETRPHESSHGSHARWATPNLASVFCTWDSMCTHSTLSTSHARCLCPCLASSAMLGLPCCLPLTGKHIRLGWQASMACSISSSWSWPSTLLSLPCLLHSQTSLHTCAGLCCLHLTCPRQRLQLQLHSMHANVFVVNWDGPDNPKNPQKCMCMLLCALGCLTHCIQLEHPMKLGHNHCHLALHLHLPNLVQHGCAHSGSAC